MPATSVEQKKGNKGLFALLLVLLILFAGLLTGLYVVTREEPQDIRNRAAEVTPAQSCPVNGSACSWDALQGINRYQYTIKDLTAGTTVKEGQTQSTSVTFTPIVGHKYECTVKAVNECAPGPEAKAQNTCSAGPTATPTPTGEVTNTPTPTGAVTNTPTPTGTLTPTPTGTLTPTPTNTPGPTATNTPVPEEEATPTEIVIAEAEEEEEVAPTVPEAGTSAGVYFMVAAGLILITLMLVF